MREAPAIGWVAQMNRREVALSPLVLVGALAVHRHPAKTSQAFPCLPGAAGTRRGYQHR